MEHEKNMPGLPNEDAALLQRIQNGDRQAVALLFDRYSRFVYCISLRVLHDPAAAEDVLQEVFLQIWRSPGQLIIDKSLPPWLAVVSRNRSIDLLRKKRPYESIESVVLASQYDTALQAERRLMCEKARDLIDELPAEQRIALEMAYFKGMTQSEISDSTGSPLGTIKTRIRNALKHLRKCLQSEGCTLGR
jgi:RNA polymerase sigma-70 factor (ECF subfamily)